MAKTKRRGGIGPDILAGIFLTNSVLHFALPKFYEAIMPPAIPRKREVVYVTGAMEAGLALAVRRRWSWAAVPSAVFLAAVFPANVQMALDSGSGKMPGPLDDKRIAYGRLPLQLPLIWWALKIRKKG
jgi:uncharacterized membrane protein